MMRAAVMLLVAASGCAFGRQYDEQSWRELRRVKPSWGALRVDAKGAYDAETCAKLCEYSGAKVELCYPVDFVVPVPRARILECDYAHRRGERRAVSRSAVDPAKIDERGYLARESCDRVCESAGDEVTTCTVEPEPKPLAPGGSYVVCAIHMPGGSDLSWR
jgi:hypothetical protein